MPITFIDLDARTVTLDDGSELPITVMYDAEENETDDPDRAERIVAGAGDVWFSIVLSEIERAEIQ